LMPVAFTFFFGFAFGGMAAQGDNRLLIGVVDDDPGGVLSEALIALLENSSTVRPVVLNSEEAENLDQKVLNGELAAGLVIPPGFSESALQDDPRMLQAVIDEETQDGQVVRRALQTNILRLMSTAYSARVSAQAYEAEAGFQNEQEKQAFLREAVDFALRGWMSQPLSIRVTGPVIANRDPLAVNPYNQFSPGMIVQFAIFGLVQASMLMVVERRTGAMARMLTTPMTKVELIGGHTLAMFIIFFGQQLVLILFGQFFLNVDYLREPLATLLMMTVISLWVAALGLLISALVKKEEHVVMSSMVAMFLFSSLGGAWFSLEMVGKTFAAIGHLTPSAWAIDGYQNIILRGLDLESVLLPAGIILAYAVVFFLAAIWRFKY
jgi:ABC-2 type transport system permease protein